MDIKYLLEDLYMYENLPFSQRLCNLKQNKKRVMQILVLFTSLLFICSVSGYFDTYIDIINGNWNFIKFFISVGVMISIGGLSISIILMIKRVIQSYEKEIYYQTYYDSLTGLPNRFLLHKKLTDELHQANQNTYALAILFLDLDIFKLINDTLGYKMGDLLLQKVSQRLISYVKGGGSVYRQGGDEFIIILSGITREMVTKVTQEILDTMSRAFKLADEEIFITTTIGVSLYPSDGKDQYTLIKNAETAMYYAKKQNKNNYQFYNSNMLYEFPAKMVLKNSLHKALKRKEFLVYYQPQINANTGDIIGIEALLRWKHPSFGLVSPSEFIPLAEKTGLIIPIGEWVLQTACAQNKALQKAGFPPLIVSVNISQHQFVQHDFVETVARILKETELNPKYLELEITENVTQNIEKIMPVLQKLKSLGVRISIDDFGTGYSSLNYLKHFPVDTIKIDKSFIQDVCTDIKSQEIIKTIIKLGHSLKLKLVAEGVESKEQFHFLKEHKCDEIQGYFFSKPVSIQTFKRNFQQA